MKSKLILFKNQLNTVEVIGIYRAAENVKIGESVFAVDFNYVYYIDGQTVFYAMLENGTQLFYEDGVLSSKGMDPKIYGRALKANLVEDINKSEHKIDKWTIIGFVGFGLIVGLAVMYLVLSLMGWI